jgi:PAS domain S-box-containing protein
MTAGAANPSGQARLNAAQTREPSGRALSSGIKVASETKGMPNPPSDHLIDTGALESLSRPELETHAKALRIITAIVDVILESTDAYDLVLTSRDASEVLAPAVETLAQFTRFPAISVFAVNRPTQQIDLLYARGFGEAVLRGLSHLPIDGSLTGLAVKRREIVLSPDVRLDEAVEPTAVRLFLEEGFSAMAAVPLVAGDRAVGALDLVYKGQLGLTVHERDMLKAIAKAMAVAVERTKFTSGIERERRRLDATLRSMGNGILTTDAAGHVTLMNTEAERLTAWTQGDALGHPIEEILRIQDAKSREPLESPVRRSLGEHAIVPLPDDTVLAARNGTERDIVGSCAPIIDSRDEAYNAVLACQDVTRSHRDHDWLVFLHNASVLLQGSLDWETTLTQAARLAVASVADVCGIDILHPDCSIRRLVGAHTDPTKQPLVDTLVRLTRLDPNAAEGAPMVIRTREPVVYGYSREEARLPGLEGRLAGSDDPDYVRAILALDLSSALICPLIAGERTLGAITFAARGPHRFDESDVQRAEQLTHCFSLAIENARLLREAQDAVAVAQDALAVREEFLRLASHELKTPITALHLALKALERMHRAWGEPVMVERFARALRQSTRLAELCETLLEVSRLASGRMVLHLQDVDLRLLVADEVERSRGEAARAGCAIELGAGSPVATRCDKGRIERAVHILLVNAFRYGTGRPVEVAVDASGHASRISVTDHGIGIAPEDTGRIFELFERAASSRHYGGLGLGLYVAREIVSAHQGSILVASEPGAGSTFTIVLPRSGSRDAA